MSGDAREFARAMQARTILYFGEEGVDRVANTTVAIAGLGGVGAITAELLARWGVQRFRLLDLDRYEASNMNRQLFATSKTLGEYKVDATADRILEINPHAIIETRVKEMINNDNAEPFVKGADLVVQNADRPSAKLLYLAARRHKVPLVNGYASLTGGRVQTFDFQKSSCESALEAWWTKWKLGGKKPLEERTPEEVAEFDRQFVHSTAPSVNFVTNMVGCLIVAEAVKLLTGKGEVVEYPRYLTFDTFRYQMKIRSSTSPINPDNWEKVLGVMKKRKKKL